MCRVCRQSNGNLEIAAVVDENILWLEVSVDEVEGLHVFESQGHLTRVELGRAFTGQQNRHCYEGDERFTYSVCINK